MREGQNNQLEYALGSFELPLFSAAAHELKSPLSLIRQLAMKIEQGELSSDEVMTYARRIQLTSERSLRLASDLAHAGNFDNLQPLFPLEPVNPNAVCQQVMSDLGPLYREQGRRIEVKYHRRSPLCVANTDLLTRVVSNFADNALKYASDSVAVKLQTTTRANNSIIRVAVRDYGPGLPAKFWQQITNGATDTYTPITRRPDSSGLGLFLAGQFATAMNGELGVIRHHDGTTFYIDLMGSTQTSFV